MRTRRAALFLTLTTTGALLGAADIAGCGGRIAPIPDAELPVAVPPADAGADVRDADASVAVEADAWVPVDADDAPSDARTEDADAGVWPPVLVGGQDHPFAITVDATYVYWSTWFGHTVMKVPLGGGTPVRIASTQGPASAIVLDATNLYWVDAFVNVMPIGGGAITTYNVSPNDLPKSLAVDARYIYWSNPVVRTLRRMPIGGGSPTILTDTIGSPGAIAVDDTSVYAMLDYPTTDWGFVKMPTGGGPATYLARAQSGRGIALDATRAYFTVQNAVSGQPSVASIPKAGGSITALGFGGQPWGIALDATHVYWVDMGNGTPASGGLFKVPKAGGPVVTMARGLAQPMNVAVDDTRVYFTAQDDGTVRWMAK